MKLLPIDKIDGESGEHNATLVGGPLDGRKLFLAKGYQRQLVFRATVDDVEHKWHCEGNANGAGELVFLHESVNWQYCPVCYFAAIKVSVATQLVDAPIKSDGGRDVPIKLEMPNPIRTPNAEVEMRCENGHDWKVIRTPGGHFLIAEQPQD